MLFKYTAIDQSGATQEGQIETVSRDTAIASLHSRGFSVSAVEEVKEAANWFQNISFFESVSKREIVFLSRQIATLFQAQVSSLRVFRILSAESENKLLQKILSDIGDDIQAGTTLSKALEKHPKAFNTFYVSMVRAAEESGKLDETFLYLADYLDRSYEVFSKVRNALIYPAFVICTFIVVMILMMTMVIPKISQILTEAGQELPIYTRIVIGISDFFVNYGFFLLGVLVVGGFFLARYIATPAGRSSWDTLILAIPYAGDLNRKLCLARIADNLSTMLGSGISMVQATEITASIVGNAVYKDLLMEVSTAVKNGGSMSEALSNRPEIPGIMTAMIRVGEETGEMGSILKTLAKFYEREVSAAVDTLIDLIEPVMIVALGLGVGVLLVSILMPIYNLTSAI